MGCCGSQRQAYAAAPAQRRQAGAAVQATSRAAVPTPPVPAAPRALFQYRGDSALSIFNPATGRRYVFASPGARLHADAADLAWLAGFPWLVRVA